MDLGGWKTDGLTWVRGLAVALLLMTAASGPADTVVLKNGAKFDGVIEQQNEREVVLRLAYGTMSFATAEVKSVERASADENERLKAAWVAENQRVAKERAEREQSRNAPKDEGQTTGRETGESSKSAAPSVSAGSVRSKLGRDLLKSGTWHRESTQHFRIFSQDPETGKAVANKAEYYLEKIRYDLNMPREVKWTDPSEVFVVKDEGDWDILAKTQAHLTSVVGFSSAREREIFIRGVSDAAAAGTFAHELSHIVIFEFAQQRAAPLWLQEGLAIYESGELVGQSRLLGEAKMQGKLMTFGDLHDTWRGHYPPTQDLLIIFYLESSSIVEFLISRFGRQKFGDFASEVISQADLTGAVRKAFTGQFTSANDLYAAWLQSLGR